MKSHLMLSCSAALFLSACGGSGGGDTVPLQELQELQSRTSTFFDGLNGVVLEDVASTPFATLPASGSVSYTGVAFVGVPAPGENGDNEFLAIGSTTLVADFGEQKITGSAEDFFELANPNAGLTDTLKGQPIAGSLTYAMDQTAPGQNAYAGQFTGSVTPTKRAVINVDTAMTGRFIGGNAEAFSAVKPEEEAGVNVAVFTNKD